MCAGDATNHPVSINPPINPVNLTLPNTTQASNRGIDPPSYLPSSFDLPFERDKHTLI